METFRLLLLLAVTWAEICSGQKTTVATELVRNATPCEDYGHITVTSHIGWPLKLDCVEIALKMKNPDLDHTNATCLLQHSNKTNIFRIHSESKNFENFPRRISNALQFPTIDVDGTDEFFMEYKISSIGLCGRMKILIKHSYSNAQNYKCSTLPESYNEPFRANVGDTIWLPCTVAYDGGVRMFVDPMERTYKWWYNCSETLPQNAVKDSLRHNELKISNLSFSNGGEYVCAVKYKNQTRFARRRLLCVKDRVTHVFSMKCPKKVKGESGSDVNITCYVDYGAGQDASHPVVQWFYQSTESGSNNQLCSLWVDFQIPGRQNESKVLCENIPSPTTPNGKCYRYQPPSDEETVEKRNLVLTLLIKNFHPSDAGKYAVRFDVHLETIEVFPSEDGHLMNKTVAIGIGIMFCVIFVVLIFVLYWRRTDILWFNKKYFYPYVKDEKIYDVGLVYHFSDDDMSQESRILTVKMVESLLDFTNKSNLKVFDENRDDIELQLVVEKISQTLSDSRAIIVLLNEEFASDDWNMLQIHTALKNMVEGGTNVIFIPFPNFLANLSKQKHVTTVLKHAMKFGTTIHWSGKLPLSGRFKRHLEYALPKLKRDESKFYDIRSVYN